MHGLLKNCWPRNFVVLLRIKCKKRMVKYYRERKRTEKNENEKEKIKWIHCEGGKFVGKFGKVALGNYNYNYNVEGRQTSRRPRRMLLNSVSTASPASPQCRASVGERCWFRMKSNVTLTPANEVLPSRVEMSRETRAGLYRIVTKVITALFHAFFINFKADKIAFTASSGPWSCSCICLSA